MSWVESNKAVQPAVKVEWCCGGDGGTGGLDMFLRSVGGEGSFGGWIVLATFLIGTCEVGDEVGHCIVSSLLGGPLVDGLGEDSIFSEGLDEWPHVCCIRDWIVRTTSAKLRH